MGKFLYETPMVEIFQESSEIFVTSYRCMQVTYVQMTEIIGREGELFLYNVLVHKLTQH